MRLRLQHAIVRLVASLLLAGLAGCHAASSSPEAPDAQVCPPGEEPGPLGTSCVTLCQHPCASDDACGGVGFCVRGDSGCAQCSRERGALDAGQSTCETRACGTQNDCCAGSTCLAPGEVPRCGGPCRPPAMDCDSLRPCPAGSMCIDVVNQECSCNQQIGHVCFTPCAATSCAQDESCGSDGHCKAIPCDQGFSCPALTACHPGQGDTHGCVRPACQQDQDCGSVNFCVNGGCYDRLGHCQPAFP